MLQNEKDLFKWNSQQIISNSGRIQIVLGYVGNIGRVLSQHWRQPADQDRSASSSKCQGSATPAQNESLNHAKAVGTRERRGVVGLRAVWDARYISQRQASQQYSPPSTR